MACVHVKSHMGISCVSRAGVPPGKARRGQGRPGGYRGGQGVQEEAKTFLENLLEPPLNNSQMPPAFVAAAPARNGSPENVNNEK